MIGSRYESGKTKPLVLVKLWTAIPNCSTNSKPCEAADTVTGQPLDKPISGVSVKFGYYPEHCDVETDRFSVQTLPGHADSVANIASDPNVVKDWIYPGAQQQRDFMSGEISSMPYNARVFGLPKTHALTLHESKSQDDLDFVVWCLSFCVGMRLTTTEAGFLDATPIKPGKLVDFAVSPPLSRSFQPAVRNFARPFQNCLSLLSILLSSKSMSGERSSLPHLLNT
jgi:hypothetical protein